MRPRHLLVVAWWFPPLAGGGVHRPLQFVRHLARRGLRVSVLTAAPPGDAPRDEGLLDRIPSGVRVLRVPLLDPFRIWARIRGARGAAAGNGTAAARAPAPARWRDLVTEAIALPDRWLPWVVPAAARAAVALRGDEPELVFSTSPPHSVHLVAHALAGIFGAPLVLDFRDPWIGNPFRRYVAPIFARADSRLERRVVQAAAQVVVNTPALERQFRSRYPGIARLRTIPNGFDPEAFAGLPAPEGGGSPGRVEIAHYGQLYGLRSGRYLLEALALLRRDRPDAFARLRVLFVGSIDGEAAFRALAAQLRVEEAVAFAGTLPHREALARQRRSDVLLLLGPENREPELQVPGKLYEYLAARRPILALSRRGGAIAELLETAGVAHERAEPDEPDAIAAALARRAERGGEPAVGDAPEAFGYDRLSDRLLDCLEDAWRARSGPVRAGA